MFPLEIAQPREELIIKCTSDSLKVHFKKREPFPAFFEFCGRFYTFRNLRLFAKYFGTPSDYHGIPRFLFIWQVTGTFFSDELYKLT